MDSYFNGHRVRLKEWLLDLSEAPEEIQEVDGKRRKVRSKQILFDLLYYLQIKAGSEGTIVDSTGAKSIGVRFDGIDQIIYVDSSYLELLV